tara:strand:+ start:252 stop:425 length:174 start_codon:yes stop_codon:yes gene_type:complete
LFDGFLGDKKSFDAIRTNGSSFGKNSLSIMWIFKTGVLHATCARVNLSALLSLFQRE